MRDSYRTLASTHCHEIAKVKGSRFLGLAAPAADRAAAEAHLAAVRKQHWDATHHVFAYRLGGRVEDPAGAALRYSDDGEPAGTGGRPVLQQIEARSLYDVLVVVSRWFGGTKLGSGGLARAYGDAAAAVLDAAGVQLVRITETYAIRYAYDLEGAVQGLLANAGLEPSAAEYGAAVRLLVEVPLAQVEPFLRQLRDRTAGRALVERSEQ